MNKRKCFDMEANRNNFLCKKYNKRIILIRKMISFLKNLSYNLNECYKLIDEFFKNRN